MSHVLLPTASLSLQTLNYRLVVAFNFSVMYILYSCGSFLDATTPAHVGNCPTCSPLPKDQACLLVLMFVFLWFALFLEDSCLDRKWYQVVVLETPSVTFRAIAGLFVSALFIGFVFVRYGAWLTPGNWLYFGLTCVLFYPPLMAQA